MISLYRPGASAVHKSPAAFKLFCLALFFIAVGLLQKNVALSLSAGVVVVALYLLAGQSIGKLVKQIWNLKVLVVIVLIPQMIFNGPGQGVNNSVVILAGVMLATLVSITTKTSEIVSLIERLTRSRSFALLIALGINSIGLVIGFSKNITEAGLARGVRPNPVRQIVTLFVVSLRFADDYAEALAARGVRV